jgi:hypothetical protein
MHVSQPSIRVRLGLEQRGQNLNDWRKPSKADDPPSPLGSSIAPGMRSAMLATLC